MRLYYHHAALGCKRLFSPNAIEGEFLVCGFACLWQHDDAALAKQMIEKIEHAGAGRNANLSFTKCASDHGALPIVNHWSVGRIATDLRRQQHPGCQRRDFITTAIFAQFSAKVLLRHAVTAKRYSTCSAPSNCVG